MSMNLQQLLGIVKRGWKVTIGMKRAADWTDEHPVYDGAMLANPLHSPEANLRLDSPDGQAITDDQFLALCQFLGGMDQRVPGDDPLGELVMAQLRGLGEDGLPLPQPLRYVAQDDGGSDIEDDQGTVLGHVDADASIAEQGDAVVAAVAVGAAAGLMSKPSKVLPAASAEMMDSALLASAELDELDAALQAMPPEKRPVPTIRPDDKRKAERAARTAQRQQQLLSNVYDALVGKGVVNEDDTLQATALSDLCIRNGQRFRYGSDKPGGTINRYMIVDGAEHLVAAGTLKTPFLSGNRGHYLPPVEVRRLRDQVEDQAALNKYIALAPNLEHYILNADAEVDRFAEVHPDGVEGPGEEGEHGRATARRLT